MSKRAALIVALPVGTLTGFLSIVFFQLRNEDWAGPLVLEVLPTNLLYLLAVDHDFGPNSVFLRYLLPALGALLAAGILSGILVCLAAFALPSVSWPVAIYSGVFAGFAVTVWSVLRVGVWSLILLLLELFAGLVSSSLLALASVSTFLGVRLLLNRRK